jgi:sugar phosphate isomerase/epimerase
MKKKFWISSSYFKAKNIDELVMKMDELGFKRVELTAGLDYEENIANKLINYEKEGYEFLIHNYFPKPVDDFVINLSTENKELESKTLDLCMNSIKIASKLRNKVYSLHSGFAFEMTTDLIGNLEKQKSYLRNQEYNVEKNLEIMIKNSNKILRFADNLGVSIYFENNMIPNYNFKDVQNIPYHLIEPGGIKNFFERVEYANCGLMLDVSHAKIVSEILSINPYEFFNIDNIGYLQLSESDGFKDASETFNEKSWFFDKLSNFEKEFLILEIKETRISDFEKLEKIIQKI